MIRVLLLLLSSAWADNSIQVSDDLQRCTMNDSPFRKLWLDPRVKELRPGGDLALRDLRGRYVLYSTSLPDGPARSVLWDSQGLQMPVVLPGPIETQLVIGERGELRGFIALHRDGVELFSPSAQRIWRNAKLPGWGDSAATLVAGDLLLVARFHRIATGSSLVALDLATGQVRWIAEVQQLSVAHSKYYNDVTLERAGTSVVMRGYEAAGCYRQVFELATGARLSAQMPRR